MKQEDKISSSSFFFFPAFLGLGRALCGIHSLAKLHSNDVDEFRGLWQLPLSRQFCLGPARAAVVREKDREQNGHATLSLVGILRRPDAPVIICVYTQQVNGRGDVDCILEHLLTKMSIKKFIAYIKKKVISLESEVF